MKLLNGFSPPLKSSRCGLVPALGIACLLWCGAAALARGSQYSSPLPTIKPLFRTTAVAPFTIEPEAIEGVLRDAMQEERIRVLSDQVTKHVHHWLLKTHTTGAIRRLAAAPDSSAAPPGQPLITGTIRLPVSLPTDLKNRRLVFHRERFATATVTMQLPNGTQVEAEAVLNGKDVPLDKNLKRYLSFARGVVWVQEVYAEKAVDRALERLLQEATSRRTTIQAPIGRGKAQ